MLTKSIVVYTGVAMRPLGARAPFSRLLSHSK